MASPVDVSSLVAEDTLKYALPTFLGFALFAPFWDPAAEPATLLLISIFVGFAATPLIGSGYEWLVAKYSARLRAIGRRQLRESKRWDYDRTFIRLGNDDRDALTLSEARGTFSLMLSVYLRLFVLACTAAAIHAVGLPSSLEGVKAVLLTPIPMLSKMYAPAGVCIFVGVVVSWQSLAQFCRARDWLFGEQYPEYARKQHLDKGDVAKAVWGHAILPAGTAGTGGGARSARLLDSSGRLLSEATIDADLEFTFPVAADDWQDKTLTVEASVGSLSAKKSVTFAEKDVPEVILQLLPPAPPAADATANELARGEAGAGSASSPRPDTR
jgi:hypothetical protein